jgi:hypothetical protein
MVGHNPKGAGFQLCPNRRAGKAAHREGHYHTAGISREDFRRAGDISGDVQADTTLTQITDIEYPRGIGWSLRLQSSFRPNGHRPVTIVR